ncbi:hypothetical protein J4442_00755 [Candidatus Woesearchaeota archaeon]|nr:hypothetical protein [Candidatus Woesearchaeota archaeon]
MNYEKIALLWAGITGTLTEGEARVYRAISGLESALESAPREEMVRGLRQAYELYSGLELNRFKPDLYDRLQDLAGTLGVI